MNVICKTIATFSAVLCLVSGANALTIPNAGTGETQDQTFSPSFMSWILGDPNPGSFDFDSYVRNAICRLTTGCSGAGAGIEVAQAGPLGILGSEESSDGGVYVFDTATGQALLRLQSAQAEADGDFGSSLAANAQSVAVGSVGQVETGGSGFDSAGLVYLFDGATGNLVRQFTTPSGDANDGFGYSVALNGSTLAIGAPGGDAGEGVAYLFDTTTGDLLQRLSAPEGLGTTDFGTDVALFDGVLAVSGNLAGPNGATSPTAFLFDSATGDFLGQAPAAQLTDGLGQFTGSSSGDNGGVSLAASPLPAVPLPAPVLLLLAALGGTFLARRKHI